MKPNSTSKYFLQLDPFVPLIREQHITVTGYKNGKPESSRVISRHRKPPETPGRLSSTRGNRVDVSEPEDPTTVEYLTLEEQVRASHQRW